MPPLCISVCLGSSCFARGNGQTTRALLRHVKEEGLEGQVELQGVLCEGKCSCGPNLRVNGRAYSGVTSAAVLDIIERHLKAPSGGDAG